MHFTHMRGFRLPSFAPPAPPDTSAGDGSTTPDVWCDETLGHKDDPNPHRCMFRKGHAGQHECRTCHHKWPNASLDRPAEAAGTVGGLVGGLNQEDKR